VNPTSTTKTRNARHTFSVGVEPRKLTKNENLKWVWLTPPYDFSRKYLRRRIAIFQRDFTQKLRDLRRRYCTRSYYHHARSARQ
jgi:hypothetical protein